MWWVNKFGNVSGPYSEEQIRKLVQSNRLTRLCKISEDRAAWMRLDESEFWKRSSSRPEVMALPEASSAPMKMNVPSDIVESNVCEAVSLPPQRVETAATDADMDTAVPVLASHGAELEGAVQHQQTIQQQKLVKVRPARQIQVVAEAPGESKSRVAYIVLALFLGGLGIHNFYAGRTGSGVCQLLLTVLLGWLVIPWLVVVVWNLVEICVVTTDGNGRRMI